MQNLILILAVLFGAFLITQQMEVKGLSMFPGMSINPGVIPLIAGPGVVPGNPGFTAGTIQAGPAQNAGVTNAALMAATSAANAAANNNPIVNIPGEVNIMQIPQAMTLLNVSNNAGGAVTTPTYMFNNSDFNDIAVNNGSGGGSIVNTYGDGFGGKSYNQLIRSLANGMGVKCYGFTLHYVTTSTGAEYSGGLTVATPTLLYYTGAGNQPVPKPIILNVGARNTQYLSGEMTVNTMFWVNSTMQLFYNVTANTTLSVTVMTQPLS